MTAQRLLLAAFTVAVVGDLASLVADFAAGHIVFKPLLMPLLAAYVVCAWRARDGAPSRASASAPSQIPSGGLRLLVAALLFGWGGDVLLLLDADPAFLAGMGSFAVGHICYLVLFARYGTAHARTVPIGLAYGAALIGAVALLWSDLPADLRIPVAGYSLLLTFMAFRATRLGLAAAVGGGLFLLSDTLIATGIAEWPQLPAPDFWVMSTYTAAQFLLATGVLAALRTPGPGTADRTEPRTSAA